jgi:hypothetical protein
MSQVRVIVTGPRLPFIDPSAGSTALRFGGRASPHRFCWCARRAERGRSRVAALDASA